MKVLLLNGSRREKGCTYTALSIVAEALAKNGIETEILHALPTARPSRRASRTRRPLPS